MNQMELFRKRNKIRQLIRISNRHRNVVKFSPNETDEHIQRKVDICKFLERLGEEYYTEAIFEDGSGRADIVCADRGIVIEIVNSETEMSICAKKIKYPLPLIVVNANGEWDARMIQ